jgi:hypothetical protein
MAITHKEAIDKTISTDAEESLPEKTKEIKYPAKVKNIHTNTICLESGMIKPGEEGLATQAECSNFIPSYLESI